MIRLQCGFVDTPEVEKVRDFIAGQQGYGTAFELPEYVDPNNKEAGEDFLADGERDDLFEDAARVIVQNQMGSTSLIQRRLKLGYNRAGRLMDQLQEAGIVGDNLGTKSREVKFKTENELEQYLQKLNEQPM
jgi:DNA segregation ATPase FtsK/SpoIIIE, S-DNA-T family